MIMLRRAIAANSLLRRSAALRTARHTLCVASSRLASPRFRAQCETDALEQLSGVLDETLVTVQQLSISASGQASFNLEFLSGACPQHDELCTLAADAVSSRPWSDGPPTISTSLRRPRSFMGHKAPEGLTHVGALIGVSSCKGGVGKSTIATNLAFSIAALGGRVGLVDADVHGPSLPSLVSLGAEALPLTQRAENKLLVPPVVGGVKLMSYGFIAKGAAQGKAGAAVMRGPMVAKVVSQMVSGTEWGELDYLIVDLPPGTGDVQLTLCQSFGLTGAVVVTTPQRLSRVGPACAKWPAWPVPQLASPDCLGADSSRLQAPGSGLQAPGSRLRHALGTRL